MRARVGHLLVCATVCVVAACGSLTSQPDGQVAASPAPASRSPGATGGDAADPEDRGTPQPSGSVARRSAAADVGRRAPAVHRRLRLVDTIAGEISPKSVVASGDGLFLAQNMMYRHTITAYDRDRKLLSTISDTVKLSAFGIDGYTGKHRGAPVEAAFTPSGSHAYVSNYSMYGAGFGPEGSDSCTPADKVDHSYVYRVDVATLEIDDVIEVGAVPKYVAVSPDGRWVLVTNWCTWDLSVIDAAKGREVRRIELGAYPRGIAVDPTSRTAYVAIMGGTSIAAVDLDDFTVSSIDGVGAGPRDLRMSPDGTFLYVTLNSEGAVAKVRLGSGRVRRKVTTGQAPRSLAISGDGTALYAVNYHSDTVSKIRTRDLRVVQTVETNPQPIGISYDAATRELWVACYSGSIMVFSDARRSEVKGAAG